MKGEKPCFRAFQRLEQVLAQIIAVIVFKRTTRMMCGKIVADAKIPTQEFEEIQKSIDCSLEQLTQGVQSQCMIPFNSRKSWLEDSRTFILGSQRTNKTRVNEPIRKAAMLEKNSKFFHLSSLKYLLIQMQNNIIAIKPFWKLFRTWKLIFSYYSPYQILRWSWEKELVRIAFVCELKREFYAALSRRTHCHVVGR